MVRQHVAHEMEIFMGFFSKLWSGWGKSENVLPPKKKETKKKKVVKKKKKTTKKKGK